MAVSDETRDFLDQVKKGKPRKFVILTKGANIVSLVVFKKGNFTKYVKQAKEEGRGTPSFGVVDGKGVDITFKLAISDGFDKAPVKSVVLKAYLEDEAELKCKPQFEIVDKLPVVLDEDDPLVQKLNLLRASVQELAQSAPEPAAEMAKLCDQISNELEQEQVEAATNNLALLEKMLADGASRQQPTAATGDALAPPAPPAPPAPQPDANEVLRNKLQDALNKLVPQIKDLITKTPERKVELLTPVAAIKKQLEAGELTAAKDGILALGALLKKVATPTSPEGQATSQAPAETAEQQAYAKALQELEPKYKQVIEAGKGDTDKLQKVMQLARDRASSGDYAGGLKALEGLKKAVDQLLQAAPTAGVSIFALSKARLELQRIQASAISAAEKTRDAILAEFKDDAEQQLALQRALETMNSRIGQLSINLTNELDEVTKVDASVRPKFATRVRSQVNAFFNFLITDPVLSKLDGNEFTPDTNVVEPLKAKLNEIASLLEDAAA